MFFIGIETYIPSWPGQPGRIEMKVLVTGGNGMVGRNIIQVLLSNGIEVFLPTREQLDLREQLEIREYISKVEPDAVIHCAGLVGGIHANISRPFDFLHQNLLMGSNVIESCIENGVEKLFNLGSSCMYPREGENPLKEDLILTGPLEPTNEGYAIAKIAVSRLCGFSNIQFGTKYKTLIPCNLYGKYDDFDLEKAHLIPGVIHRMHEKKKSAEGEISVWGDGTARREFMFTSDFADFVCFALENYDDVPNEMNVGLGHDLSVREYYEIIASVVGFEGEFRFDLTKPTGMQQKLVDIARQIELGWSPPTSTEEGVFKTYQYFLEEWK